MNQSAAFSPHQIIMKEFMSIQSDPNSGINASFIDNNIFRWRVTLFGPPQSPYSGGVFPAVIEFPSDYPLSPPKMKFLCPMYHPNVSDNGDVCISLLSNSNNSSNNFANQSQVPNGPNTNFSDIGSNSSSSGNEGHFSSLESWLPNGQLSAQSVLVAVQAMLADPDFESPANTAVSYTFYTNPREFMRKVKRSLGHNSEI